MSSYTQHCPLFHPRPLSPSPSQGPGLSLLPPPSHTPQGPVFTAWQPACESPGHRGLAPSLAWSWRSLSLLAPCGPCVALGCNGEQRTAPGSCHPWPLCLLSPETQPPLPVPSTHAPISCFPNLHVPAMQALACPVGQAGPSPLGILVSGSGSAFAPSSRKLWAALHRHCLAPPPLTPPRPHQDPREE